MDTNQKEWLNIHMTNSTLIPDTLLKPQEVADLLRTSYMNFMTHYQVWGIPAIHVGRRVLFRREDISKFLTKNTVTV